MPGFREGNPQIENPYPGDVGDVSNFQFLSELSLVRYPTKVEQRGDREGEYVLAKPYHCSYLVDGEKRTLTVPAGMMTDLASVPRIGRFFVGRVGPHLEASIVHDYLFVAWQLLDRPKARKADFHFSNKVMMAGMKAGGVSWLKRQIIYAAVASFVGWQVYLDEEDRWIFIDMD